MLAILGKLDTYRGDSRFTTWAYKFALLEAAVKLRRRGLAGPGGPDRARALGCPRRLGRVPGRQRRGP